MPRSPLHPLRFQGLAALAALVASCASVDDHTPGPGAAHLDAGTAATAFADTRAPLTTGETPGPLAPAAEQAPRFEHGDRAFARARKDLLESYYRDDTDEDEIYRAALTGMLEHLDPTMKGWNKLLTPSELASLHADLAGEVVGIGAEIKFDAASGYTDVIRVLPRSAAERAGLAAGDIIVTIDGGLFKGLSQADVLAHIRGKVGEPVRLSVLRADKLLTLSIVRERVSLEPVAHLTLPNRVGYVLIRGFSARTAEATRSALVDVAQQGAQALVIDLRGNQGGSFDEAVATAGLFLPRGTQVVMTRKRGGKEEPYPSKGDPVLGGVPLSVLVNGKTASSAELLAAALQEGRRAEVVGSRTFGKWSVQMIDELGNGYAIKYTVGTFHTAGGRSFEGQGMPPDVAVDLDDPQTARAMAVTDPARRLDVDVQLRTAVELLKAR